MYDKAIEFYVKAHEVYSHKLGEKHADMATINNNVGSAYNMAGDYNKAIEFFQRALDIQVSSKRKYCVYVSRLSSAFV